MKYSFLFYFLFFFIKYISADFNQEVFINEVNKILNGKKYKDVDVSISINKIHPKKKFLYEKNSDLQMIPASVKKLLLSMMIIRSYPTNKIFKTEIKYSGFIENEILNGDLYIIGKGDPILEVEGFKPLFNQLKNLKIKKINGSVHYCDDYFSDKNIENEQISYYYAPASSLNCNFNIATLFIDKPFSEPNTSFIKIKKEETKDGVRQIKRIKRNSNDEYLISNISYGQVKVAVSRPGLWTATLLREGLEKNGISVLNSTIKRKDQQKPLKSFITLESKNIDYVLQKMNKDSDNMIAKTLTYHLQKKYPHQDIMQSILKISNKNMKEFSGLSSLKELSAKEISKILVQFKKNFKDFKRLLSVLEKQSFQNFQKVPRPPEDYIAYIKTGTLSQKGVNNIALYLMNKTNQDLFTIVILCDKKNNRKKKYQGQLVNPILEVIFKSFVFDSPNRK